MAIQVIAHPPERAVRSMPLVCAGCCCCCCCCIHTVGGIAGALYGNAGQNQLITEPEAGLSAAPTLEVNGTYWRTVGLLSLITLICGLGVFGIVILLLCFPVVQFLAAVIVACRLGGAPGWKWRQLARITGFSILGSTLGIMVMFLLIIMK